MPIEAAVKRQLIVQAANVSDVGSRLEHCLSKDGMPDQPLQPATRSDSLQTAHTTGCWQNTNTVLQSSAGQCMQWARSCMLEKHTKHMIFRADWKVANTDRCKCP